MAIGVAQETCDPATGGMSAVSATTFPSSSITVAAGSILVAVACGVNGGGTTTAATFSDSVNGSTGWSTAKDVANAPLLLSVGWRYFSTVQTVVVTATYNASCHHRGIKLVEISGAVTPGALDGTPAGQFQASVATTANAITSGNLTTAAQPALVVGACMNFGNNKDPATGTGFTSTRVDWNTDVGGCRIEYKRVTATGTQSATYTGPSIDSWITIALAFDEAAAGTSPALPDQSPLRRPPQCYPRASEFTIPSSASVFTGSGFPYPERALVASRRVRVYSPDVLPPTAAAPVLPPPEALRALIGRARLPRPSDLQMAPYPGPVPVVGLRLWLRGDLGVTQGGGNVTAWADQSGFGNDVVNVGTVPFVASSINGKPGVSLSGSNGFTNAVSAPVAAGAPRTIYIVAKAASEFGGILYCNYSGAATAKTQEIWNMGVLGTAPGFIYGGRGGTFGEVDLTVVPTIARPIILRVATTGAAGATPSVTINGVSQSVSVAAAMQIETGAVGFGVGIRPYATGTLGWLGDFDEILVYDSVLSGGDDSAVQAYLVARYFPPPVQFDAPASRRPIRTYLPVLDVLPPMAVAPAPPPPELPRALPRRAPLALSAPSPALPPPPVVAAPPPPPAPLVVRAFRAVVRWIAAEVGWPAMPVTPSGPTLPPPFTAVVDPVILSTWVDSVVLTASVDPVRLSLGERLKPRKTTDTYPITNTLLSNGVAVNLTGYTVTINIVDSVTRIQKRANGACTLVDAANGKVSYQVVAGDVDTAGAYDVEWKAVSGGGVPYHFPQEGYEHLEIQPALG